MLAEQLVLQSPLLHAGVRADGSPALSAVLVQLLPSLWLGIWLVILSIWSFLIPRSFKAKLRLVSGDIVTAGDLDTASAERPVKTWKVLALGLLAGARAAADLALLVIRATSSDGGSTREATSILAVSAAAWLLATFVPLFRPQATPIYGLFAFYALDVLSRSYTLLAAGKTTQYEQIIVPAQWVLSLALLSIKLSLPINRNLPSSKTPTDRQRPSREQDSPEDGTTLGSWLLVDWMNPLLALAKKQTLEDEDVYQLSPFFRHHIIYPVFQRLQCSTLLRKIYAFAAFDLAICTLCSTVQAVFTFAGPYLLKKILEALSSDSPEIHQSAYHYALLAFGFNVFRAEVDLFRQWHARRSYERVRGALIIMVFDKASKRKDTSGSLGHRKKDKEEQDVAGADAGRILNLMNGDCYAVSQWFWEISTVIRAPIELVVSIIFLYQILGWSCLAGLSTIFITYFFLQYFGRRGIRITREMMAATDKRISVISELVSAIRFLKYYAWERIWVDKAIEAREKELSIRYRNNFNSAYLTLVTLITPSMITITAFFFYTKVAHKELTIPVAFASLATFTMIQQPLNDLPGRVLFYLNTRVSVRRLERFLDEPELEKREEANEYDLVEQPVSRGNLGFDEGDFMYPQHEVRDEAGQVFHLRAPTFTFPEGKLSIVCGGNASGKTSMLQALLGEMDTLTGRCLRPTGRGALALATQDAWLEQGTIKENILFGEEWDEQRFWQVVDACALGPDLMRWGAREDTEIGERGVSLSGGQKARVALARTIFSPAKCLLLDDPLSAVDAHTARHLVDNCFAGPLCKERTIVLVTHHVKLCASVASLIVRMSNGQATLEIPEDSKGEVVGPSRPPSALENGVANLEPGKDEREKASGGTTRIHTPANGGLITKENRAEGSVKWLVYSMYLGAAGPETWVGILSMLLAGRGITVLQQWFVKAWGESYSRSSSSSETYYLPPASQNVNPWLATYLALSLAAAAIILSRLAFSYHGSFKAARALLYACLIRVTHAPSRWLDENPTGRLLNRFTADIGSVDSSINSSVTAVVDDAIGFIASLGAVMIIVPKFIIFAGSAMILYVFLATPYVRCSRDLRRLENNHRSPLFSRFGGLLRGLKVVRAFGQEERYKQLLMKDLDLFQAMDHFFWTARFYLTLRFDFVGALSIYVLTLIALAGGVSQGSAAFAIVLAQQFVNALHATCWSYAKLELDVNSIERIHDLLETVQEPPAIIDSSRPPAHWPSKGEIYISDLAVRYAPHLPLALNGISLHIQAGQKIGVVGRTGSGKTTLALSLLRITDPAAGSITIDGIDIASIGLRDLRERVTIISQESTLFEGTIRSNLDPIDGELADGSTETARYVDTLDMQVTQGAENFSQGERQLLSIARALLRRTNVFIADEATASVDFATDERVQHTLRKELQSATVITIAHRLRTVIDVDRVLLLEDGVVKEFGPPKALLEDRQSAFRELCAQSNELEELKRLAGVDDELDRAASSLSNSR